MTEQLYATLKTNGETLNCDYFRIMRRRPHRTSLSSPKANVRGIDPETGQKATDKLYDGTVFHRIIEGFMIQGGDPLGNGTGGPDYKFVDEFHPELLSLSLSVGHGNAGPGTNGLQFFITVAPTTWLTGKHPIFGEVTNDASKKVVDAIATTQINPRTDRPVNDVVIESVVVETR